MPEISTIEEWSDTVEDRLANQATWNAAQTQWNGGIEAQIAQLNTGPTEPIPVGGGGTSTLFVASSSAPELVRKRADVVCTGINDHIKINDAVKSLVNQFTTKANQVNKQYGSVTLSEGRFVCGGAVIVPSRGFGLYGTSPATVLHPSVSAAVFNTTGASGVEKALVMASSTIVGQNGSMARISNLSIDCEQWGTSAALSGIAISLTTVPESGSTSPTTYGRPIPTNKNDQNWYITDVHVYGCKYGIFWTDTNGARDFFIRDCHIGAVSKAGIYAGASDSQIQGCQVITGTAPGAVGITLAGGNSKLWDCKLSYIETGVLTTSSRPTVDSCEAQDCTNGFKFNGSANVTAGTLVCDTQEPGQIGIDLTGCTGFTVEGFNIYTRGSGTWATGINLPSGTEYGTVKGSVGQTGITNQVAKTGTAVTASANLPRGPIIQISRPNGNLVSNGNVV